eukprot:TRINITY_DN20247_c0_g1_i1.p1 TRINITY_DN20247_c0_g1~~TRINITY_DN20247_c0_g1_i1.p1  ORF type:complete len:503 (+),score=60.65 TRINITY_DN20247_c0_g1_i1:53-1510(+)
MGIQGLLKALEDKCKETTIAEFAGKTAAVDALSWLHKGLSAAAFDLATGKNTKAHINYCIRRAVAVKRCGVTPVLIFDGASLPAKRAVNEERRRQRAGNKKEGERRLAAGDLQGARKCFAQAAEVTAEMKAELCRELERAGVAAMTAPYEADAQMAYLSMHGHVHVCISEDSDLLAWGCQRVLFKMDAQGVGQLIELEEALEERSFSQFQAACILMGCDYLPRLPRAGPRTAFRLVDRFGSAPSSLVSGAKEMGLNVPDNYEAQFVAAWDVFQHQLIIDPVDFSTSPLRPVSAGRTARSPSMHLVSPSRPSRCRSRSRQRYRPATERTVRAKASRHTRRDPSAHRAGAFDSEGRPKRSVSPTDDWWSSFSFVPQHEKPRRERDSGLWQESSRSPSRSSSVSCSASASSQDRPRSSRAESPRRRQRRSSEEPEQSHSDEGSVDAASPRRVQKQSPFLCKEWTLPRLTTQSRTTLPDFLRRYGSSES